MTVLALDYETFSEVPLVGAASVGLHNYSVHPSTEVLMCAYSINGGRIEHVEIGASREVPSELNDALLDPQVEKTAYNSQFERTITRNVLGIETPIQGWRCTMALAYLQSFTGTLGDVGAQMGLPSDKMKDQDGKRLIKLFSQPQKQTKASRHTRRNADTDPEEWQKFCDYNIRDLVAELEIRKRLLPYYIPEEEWAYYECDQEMNDRGIPIDVPFVCAAIGMVARRKRELVAEMRDSTGVANPNSTAQLLPWLQARGYPFHDLMKNTVTKVLSDNKGGETPGFLDADAAEVLRLRAYASSTSVMKYNALLQRVGDDANFRFGFQFSGATRTGRHAGRSVQPQNLPRTPKALEDVERLTAVTDAIRDGDYDLLNLLMAEPMVGLSGCVRSSIQAPPGYQLVVSDLSSIESAVIAWLSGCERLLEVFRSGRDPYKDFAVELYGKPYDDITKAERTIAKPSTLGCGFKLGGGTMKAGKKTGLWAYAESMGVHITKEEAARQVALFRSTYHEIPDFWSQLEKGVARVLMHKYATVVVNGLLTISYHAPYLLITLPSGRNLHYYQPRMTDVEFVGEDGTPYTRRAFSYMGVSQITKRWERIYSHSGKVCENAVQATAREVLKVGSLRARAYGFDIVMTVHDELACLVPEGSNTLTLDALRHCMADPIPWATGLPLGAAGYTSRIYRKD